MLSLVALASALGQGFNVRSYDLTCVPENLRSQPVVPFSGLVSRVLASNVVMVCRVTENVVGRVTNYVDYASPKRVESYTRVKGDSLSGSGNLMGARIPRPTVYRTNIVVLVGYHGWTNVAPGDQIYLTSVVIGPPVGSGGVRHVYNAPPKTGKVHSN